MGCWRRAFVGRVGIYDIYIYVNIFTIKLVAVELVREGRRKKDESATHVSL